MENKKRHLTRKPNIFVYGLFRFLSKLFAKFKFKLKCTRNDLKGIKGPAIILGNHGTALDFVNLTSVLKQRVNYVISNSYYQTLPFKPIINKVGLIPKQQFQTLPADLKAIKEVIDFNGIVGMYPAGLMTENGKTTPIPKATGKFLKWLNCDIYIAFSFGAYLTSPKWGKVKRKGRTDLEIKKILSKEELNRKTVEEIDQLLNDNLIFDEYKTNKEKKYKFKNGDNLEGLENILYICPNCKKEFTLDVVNKNKLVCNHCGYSVIADEYSQIHSDDLIVSDISDWFTWIENKRTQEIIDNPNFTLESKCKIFMLNYKKGKYIESGSGIIKLNNSNFIIEGITNGCNCIKEISYTQFASLPFKSGYNFDIQDGKDIYRISLENGREVIKWVATIRSLHRINNNELKEE